MPESNLRLNVVRDNYNETHFEYEVRRLPEESPVEYAMTRRWLDEWVAPISYHRSCDATSNHSA